jgi:hypothetical protein
MPHPFLRGGARLIAPLAVGAAVLASATSASATLAAHLRVPARRVDDGFAW